MRFGVGARGFAARSACPAVRVPHEPHALTKSSEGRSVATHFGCPFIETSAKSRTNVEKAFYDTVREIRRFNRDMSGFPAGAAANGKPQQFDMDEREPQSTGCCGGKCAVM